MAKKEFVCYNCDNHFTLNFKSNDDVKYCPFCGEELELNECNDIEEYD